MKAKNLSVGHRPPSDGMVRIGTAVAVPAVLRTLGANPDQVLQEGGFDLSLFDDPGNRLSFSSRGRLLAHCVASTGCPHFGLLVGQRAGLESLGLVGLLVKYSPDVATALRSLIRYAHLHTGGAAVTLSVDRQTALLDYKIHQPGTPATDQVNDGAVAILFNIMRGLCGPGWKPSRVMFTRRKPDEIEPFQQFFGAPLHFNAEQNGLVFPAEWLAHRLPEIDPEVRRMLKEQIDILEARHPNEFPAQVRSVLRTALLTPRTSAADIAALFSITSRTLNRRLEAFGVSFRDLVEEERYEIARQTLLDSDMRVADIAALLDYKDASSFNRAFRRWSGMTPERWRVEARRQK